MIRRIRKVGALAGMITNGYLLVPERIKRLNAAGLDHMQISIDNVQPDEISKKSLKVLDRKLQNLSDNADFHVNINSVVGGGIKNPNDALVIGHRALELGFTSTIGIIHDGSGQLKPLVDDERPRVLRDDQSREEELLALQPFIRKRLRTAVRMTGVAARVRDTCISAKNGLVHYCSQQRGWPGVSALGIYAG